MHPVSRHVQIGAVGRGTGPGHHRPSEEVTAAGQPGSTSDDWLFSDNKPCAQSMEPGLRAASAQLENRQRRFGLRLLSLPQGDQAWEIVGAPTAIGRMLANALAYVARTESTVLLEEPGTRRGAAAGRGGRSNG